MFILGFDDRFPVVKFQIQSDGLDGSRQIASIASNLPHDTKGEGALNEADRLPVDEEGEGSFVELLKTFESKDTDELRRIIEEDERSNWAT